MRTLAQRYRLIRTLDEGSMGEVHLAQDLHDGRKVAVKILPMELSRDAEWVARLSREAQALSAIDHPSVARVIELGADPDGTHWMVLEYVAGRPLRDVLAGGALHPARALKVAKQMVAGLGAAHAAGIIHRDVKPENVMLLDEAPGFDDDRVKVLDFGIAKLDENRHGVGPATAAGTVLGTPHYMSPEQVRRAPLDARSDLYSVGVVLHECITGVPPFDGEDVTIMSKHLQQSPPSLTSPVAPDALTLAVRACVARLLSKDPSARPQSAAAAIAEIDEAIASIGQAHLESMTLRTGGTYVPAGSLPAPPMPKSKQARNVDQKVQVAPGGFVKRRTAKLAAFARSYGLSTQQLLFAFAVAFGLITIVMFVALWS
jgi:serine/threonine-protein kinase